MKKKVTIVPKDKCPLDVLAKMGDRTKNAWIYLHANVISKLYDTCDDSEDFGRSIRLIFDETEENPTSTSITFGTAGYGPWHPVCFIEAIDIAFEYESLDPDEIFFLRMEE